MSSVDAPLEGAYARGVSERLLVPSADGTTLSVITHGQGRPLVLVHGAGGNAERWSVAEGLASRFTLFALDRRGRGGSHDSKSGAYALAREAEDVAAVLTHAGPDAVLLGHSFGGLVALEAANLVTVAKVLVYEPYAAADPLATPSPVTQSYQAMIATPEALLERFYREIVHFAASDLERLRASPAWPGRVAAACTIPREMAAVECHSLRVEGLVRRGSRVRFLVGERSPAFLREATARIHALVPGSDVVELEGQGHVAMESAPALFQREVTDFFESAPG
jgi:pimeloyl-ACP methyl ester carboxylesterase